MSDPTFKAFIGTTIDEAQKFSLDDRMGSAVKNNIRDLIQIINTLEERGESLASATPDANLTKRRYEQLKKDHRELERGLEKFKEKTVPDIVLQLKAILENSLPVISRASTSEDMKNAQLIKDAAQKIAGHLKTL